TAKQISPRILRHLEAAWFGAAIRRTGSPQFRSPRKDQMKWSMRCLIAVGLLVARCRPRQRKPIGATGIIDRECAAIVPAVIKYGYSPDYSYARQAPSFCYR